MVAKLALGAAVLLLVLNVPSSSAQVEEDDVVPQIPKNHRVLETRHKVRPVAVDMDDEHLDDRGLHRHREAALLAADAVRSMAVLHATVFVCWGSEDAFLYQLLSSAGIAVQFLRGPEFTRSEYLRRSLLDTIHGRIIVLDAACPYAERLLEMASRLRLFHIQNMWVIFENGLLQPDLTAYEDVPIYSEEDFGDLDNVTVHRFGAQNREDAIDPEEDAFLEVRPPTVARARTSLLQEDTARLSANALRILDGKIIYLDSNVLWIQAGKEGQVEAFEVFRSSKVRPLQGYAAAVADGSPAPRWRWSLDGPRLALLRERRADLQGATLRGSTIIKYPEQYTFMEDNNLRQNDLYPKMNWPVTQDLAASINFGMLVYQRDNYGWEDSEGRFDGMMGEMQRYEHDMLATAAFIRADRLRIIDMAAETFNTRTAVIYRQPSKSSVSNVYLLPFSYGVWVSTVAVSAVALVLLVAQTQWWRHHPENSEVTELSDPGDHLEVGDCITFIIGALSQQGFYCTPGMVSARITIITTFIANLFLFTSFSGSIVAIIQSPSNAIRSVQDLLDSDMHVGVHEVPYAHKWFQEAVRENDVAGELFKKKIKTHEKPGFIITPEGIAKVRRGGYAFQVEANDGYKQISDTFTESEKCDLAEVQLFQIAPMVFTVTEKSPYREVISRGLRWQRETGLLDRLHHRWESERPECTSNIKTFVPIGLQEFYPALVVLYNGVLLSIAVLCAEQIYSSRTVATCLQRCMERERKFNLSKVPIVAAAY